MLKQVGKYQIVEKIGVGGFGSVFKGRDPFIKRLVAIKTCQSEEEEIKKRFFREAEFAGNLQHRNITTIYDFGVTDDGVPYIVQEFLTGEDLDRTIKRKDAMPVGRKVRILLDVCEGLGYAHTAGIIHRDIKPANIRVLEDGTIKIMDFGIAKSMVSQSTLTQTGITLGTASYLAPEQIRGEPVDPRTDIFSLGVLAYELLTHQKPFGGDHISTVLYKILNETPGRPSDVDQSVPQSLESLVMRCLEKNRENRPNSCLEIRDELQSIADRLSGATSMSASQQQSYTGDEATIVAPDGASAFFPGAARPEAGSDLPPRDLFTKGSRQEVTSRADHTPPPRTGGGSAGSASMPLTTSSRQPTANVGNVTVGGSGGMGSDRTGSRTSGGGGVKDAPISRTTARPHAQSEVGQMSLRPSPPTFGVSPAPPPDEKKSALGIFLAAAVLVLGAGGAAVYFLVIKPQTESSGTVDPVPTPATVTPETSTSLATTTEEPTPATGSAKTTTKPVPTAAPVVKATEPAPVVVEATGSVRFVSNYPGDVIVGGKKIATQPPPIVTMKVGKQRVTFRTTGLPDISKEFEVVAGRMTDVQAVFPPRGVLEVKLAYANREAEILLDGVPVGKGYYRSQTKAGPHKLEVLQPGFETLTMEVDVPEDDFKPLSLVLTKQQ